MKLFLTRVVGIFTIAALTAVGCGGGGGGGGTTTTTGSTSVSALTMPDRVEISQIDDTNASGPAGVFKASFGDLSAPETWEGANSAYTLANVDKWNEDSESLSMINDILGIVQDTAYESFVNAGPYKALVRDVGESDSSQSGQSQVNTTTEQLMEIVVDVTRANDTSDMIIKIWVEMPEGGSGQIMRVRGYFEVSRGVSTAYPYGEMTANFEGVKLDANGVELSPAMFTMAMSVTSDNDGNVVVEINDSGDDNGQFTWDNQIRLVTSADFSAGDAYIYENEYESWSNTTETSTDRVAFNDTYYKIEDQSDSSIEVLNKDVFTYDVYRYRIFNAADGSAVTMNSGFPISYVDSNDSTTKNGYVGYWGLWTPQGANLPSGTTVTQMGTSNTYTLLKVGGKLMKHTKSSITLANLNGVEMSKWENGTDKIISWDSTAQVFNYIGSRNNDTGAIEYAAGGSVTNWQEWDGAWCESLSAYLRIGSVFNYNNDGSLDTGNLPTNSSVVNYHVQETIDPSTATDLTLYTWEYTLPAYDQSAVDQSATDEPNYWQSPSEKTFTFDADTMMLKDAGNNDVLIPSSVNLASGSQRYSWGYVISPMTTTQYGSSNYFDAYDADTYYEWVSGPNDWNKFSALQDANSNFLSFDPPMHFTYTHATANDRNGESGFDGKTINMDYDGFSLQIPWNYDSSENEWEPAFNLKDGTQITNSAGTYVVKAVEIGMNMAVESDPSVAASLTIDNTISAPTVAYDSTKIALVGSMPSVSDVSVVKGELVSGN